jgi:calcineurin-like phosphoesterase family protein
VTRILAVADEVDESLYGPALKQLEPDVVLSCGDLPFEYLEYIVTVLSVPLLYVPGNHDPDLRARAAVRSEEVHPAFPVGPGTTTDPLLDRPYAAPPGPEGCVNVDGAIVQAVGLTVAGLGGSVWYAEGPNRYTQGEMRRRALRLEARARLRKALWRDRVDVLITHSPPLGVGDLPDDPAHVGFSAFHRLVAKLRPKLLLHGHVHPYGEKRPDRWMGHTRVANVVPYRMMEVSDER